MSLKRYLVSGSLWMMMGKGLTIISMMGLYVLVTRNFSPDITGTYFLALNVITFFSFVAQFGVGYTVVRIVSELRANGDEYLIYEFVRKCGAIFLLACFSVAVLYFFAHKYFLGEILFFDSNAYFGFLLAVWFVLVAIQFSLGEFFRAFRLISYTSFFSGFFSSLLSLSFVFILVFFDCNSGSVLSVIYGVIAALGVNASVGSFVLYRYVQKYKVVTRSHSQYGSRVILGQSLPYMISLTAFFLTGQSDVWLSGVYLAKSEVALYASAARMVLLISLFLVVVESVIAPIIAEMNSQGEVRQLEVLLRKTATIVFFPASIIFLLFALMGENILGLLYGDFYQASYQSLLILSFAQMVIVCTGSCGPVLLMTGHQKNIMFISLFTAALTISLGVLFIPRLGKEGAAYAVLVSFMIQQMLRVFYVKKYIGITTLIDLTLLPSLFYSLKQLRISSFKMH